MRFSIVIASRPVGSFVVMKSIISDPFS
jgi:hypothetical protein